jgi:hypothetical protein
MIPARRLTATKTPPPALEKWGLFGCLSRGALFERVIGLVILIRKIYIGEPFFCQHSQLLIPPSSIQGTLRLSTPTLAPRSAIGFG